MDLNQQTPNAEVLSRMSYSELRKVAKKHGIKGNMKAEKIIATLMLESSDDNESFSTPASKEFNSSRKNKVEKFNEDHMTPLATPRRGTYSVESAISVKLEDISSASVAFESSSLDMSNVTMERGSERKLRPRKVSFMSPAMAPRTPRNSSLRNRPKTPVASRTPLSRVVSFSTPVGKKRQSIEESFRTTPHPKKAKSETDSGTVLNADITQDKNALLSNMQVAKKGAITPSAKLGLKNDTKSGIVLNADNSPDINVLSFSMQVTKKDASTSSAKLTPKNDVKSASAKARKSRDPTSAKRKQIATPNSTKAVISKPTSSKLKRVATPNFRRIHEKAFDKMESIDDYQKRKILNSSKKIGQRPDLKKKITKAKSQIPAFSGIPFIPPVRSTTSVKLNSKMNKLMTFEDKSKPKVINENAPQQSKIKFDLKASLTRKLGYKPYSGPLKPLSESNALNTSSAVHGTKKPAVNKVVKENRSQTRSMLRGVRTNKRFELQMKNRKIQ